jgi:hypothetical protein
MSKGCRSSVVSRTLSVDVFLAITSRFRVVQSGGRRLFVKLESGSDWVRPK